VSFAGNGKAVSAVQFSGKLDMGLRYRAGQAQESCYAASKVCGDKMAMNEDEPQSVSALVPLDRMGVEELERYIAGLRAEIARAESHVAAKQSHRSAADDLFNFQ